ALDVNDEVHGSVDQLPRSALLWRVVVEEIKQDAHVKRPQQRGRGLTNILRKSLVRDRFREYRDTPLALLMGRGPEQGQMMCGLAAISEQRTQQPPVLLDDV